MPANYLVRFKNEMLYCFYYVKSQGIYYRVFENGKWHKKTLLLPNARDGYTITLDENGAVYLFCQDLSGDLTLCTNKNGNWKNRVILKNQSSKVSSIQLNPIITKSGICLVYNLYMPEEKTNYLAIQNLDEDGNWSAPIKMDRLLSLSDSMFQMQKISGEHNLVFYQTRYPETSLGYREITFERYGAFNAFHTTNYQLADNSFLTTGQSIHVLYIIKSMFSCQLIYRKKESEQFTNPLILCEAQKLGNCLLFFVKSKLFVSFINNSQLFICVSEDNGRSFTRPSRYKNKFCLHPIKAYYLSEEPMEIENYFLRQLYIDPENPCDIQILPDLYEDFYPLMKTQSVKRNSEVISDSVSEELNELVLLLRNQLEMSQNQNADKDKQLMDLTSQLHSCTEELVVTNAEKLNFQKNYNAETEQLHRRIQELEKNYKELYDKYNQPPIHLPKEEME